MYATYLYLYPPYTQQRHIGWYVRESERFESGSSVLEPIQFIKTELFGQSSPCLSVFLFFCLPLLVSPSGVCRGCRLLRFFLVVLLLLILGVICLAFRVEQHQYAHARSLARTRRTLKCAEMVFPMRKIPCARVFSLFASLRAALG